MDVTEVRKLDAYLKRLFGNPKIRVVPRPKKDDSAEVYIGEEFIGVLFVDDEDDDRSFQFQMRSSKPTSRKRSEVLRHCERSEAIQSQGTDNWIASSPRSSQ